MFYKYRKYHLSYQLTSPGLKFQLKYLSNSIPVSLAIPTFSLMIRTGYRIFYSKNVSCWPIVAEIKYF